MKIVTWNCQMAFRKKFEALDVFDADVIVVPESESPEKLKQYGVTIPNDDHIWHGRHPTKGLSVFTRNGYRARLLDCHIDAHQFVLPIQVEGAGRPFNLIAAWTQETMPKKDSYVVQANRALQAYEHLIESDTIILGDFNSNKVWDGDKKESNHTDMVNWLEHRGMRSVYHEKTGEAQGEEQSPTIYWRRKIETPYHVDYVFAHQSALPRIGEFEVGKADDWLGKSDHMPIIFEVD
jgi:exonuclease III